MEELMQKTQMQKQKSKPADTLLKTSRKKDIELTEKELDKVSGGQLLGCAAGKHIVHGTLIVR
jgi:bacteriocin-like protein